MIDKPSVVVCPHKKELFTRTISGVSHYSHDDGTDCDIFNSFVITVPEILDIMGIADKVAIHSDKETIVLRTAFVCSLPFRLKYYAMLSHISIDEDDTEKDVKKKVAKLKQLLSMWSRLIYSAYNEKTLNWELDQVFGRVAFQNLSQVTSTMHKNAIEAPSPIYTLPHFNMINIANARDDAYIRDMQDDLDFQQERTARFKRKSNI